MATTGHMIDSRNLARGRNFHPLSDGGRDGRNRKRSDSPQISPREVRSSVSRISCTQKTSEHPSKLTFLGYLANFFTVVTLWVVLLLILGLLTREYKVFFTQGRCRSTNTVVYRRYGTAQGFDLADDLGRWWLGLYSRSTEASRVVSLLPDPEVKFKVDWKGNGTEKDEISCKTASAVKDANSILTRLRDFEIDTIDKWIPEFTRLTQLEQCSELPELVLDPMQKQLDDLLNEFVRPGLLYYRARLEGLIRCVSNMEPNASATDLRGMLSQLHLLMAGGELRAASIHKGLGEMRKRLAKADWACSAIMDGKDRTYNKSLRSMVMHIICPSRVCKWHFDAHFERMDSNSSAVELYHEGK